MSNFGIAFMMGLFASLHCVVMCGPLMLAFPSVQRAWYAKFANILLYQAGRITTYAILGALLGLIGSAFGVLFNQKLLSLTIGVVLVSFGVIHCWGKYSSKMAYWQGRLGTPIARLLSKYANYPGYGLIAGFLNGLLPCGMVYLALATALNNGSADKGAIFMVGFGLGTTPLLLAVSFSGLFLRKRLRINTAKLLPYFMLFTGILLILRATDLGIPFLSPHADFSRPSTMAEWCR